jgi:hypothetical protein
LQPPEVFDLIAEMKNEIEIIDTPEEINAYRKRVLLSALKLEIAGMKRCGRSAYSIIKEEYGLKGSKQKVYEQFKSIIDNQQKF